MQNLAPKSIKKKAKTALKAHGRQSIYDLPAEEHMERLDSESDRGVIILMGSYIEDALGFSLRNAFIDAQGVKSETDVKDIDALFDFQGPVGTFSAKIKMAYALGIISRAAREIADVFREMRNAAAHIQGDISFETASLKEAVYSIIDSDSAEFIETSDDKNGSARMTFMFAATMLRQIIAIDEFDQNNPADVQLEWFKGRIAEQEILPLSEFAKRSESSQ